MISKGWGMVNTAFLCLLFDTYCWHFQRANLGFQGLREKRTIGGKALFLLVTIDLLFMFLIYHYVGLSSNIFQDPY
ncbi:hypothetical protein BDZ91DRAFT_712082 [Kalaharituber pfeilii]|nr:hypothetical protein BDZ91DRAFT_712082 [Kalaharituber pfeilii]